MWNSLGGYVFDFAVEPLLRQICHEVYESGLLVCPTSPKRFEDWKLLRFSHGILWASIPALTPDPLGEQGRVFLAGFHAGKGQVQGIAPVLCWTLRPIFLHLTRRYIDTESEYAGCS
jgi:hypothetical protein